MAKFFKITSIKLQLGFVLLFSVVFISFQLHLASNENKTVVNSKYPVCIICCAENIEQANQVAAQWPHFPKFFAVWGSPIYESRYSKPKNGDYRRSGLNFFIQAYQTSHAEGWYLSYRLARKQKNVDCKYYFTMDDDLKWSVNELGMTYYKSLNSTGSNEETKSTIIMKYLEEYKPAVTVFPWPWGDSHLAPLKFYNKKYRNQLLQPALDFDNGCIIFHQSIVDFFIPITLGGNFTASFIKQQLFFSLYIPLLFRQHAIKFNGLEFINPPAVRHPYDSKDDYAQYLKLGVKCPYGTDIRALKRKWEVEKSPKSDYEITLEMIATFMDIKHESVQDNLYLNSKYPSMKLTTPVELNCFDKLKST